MYYVFLPLYQHYCTFYVFMHATNIIVYTMFSYMRPTSLYILCIHICDQHHNTFHAFIYATSIIVYIMYSYMRPTSLYFLCIHICDQHHCIYYVFIYATNIIVYIMYTMICNIIVIICIHICDKHFCTLSVFIYATNMFVHTVFIYATNIIVYIMYSYMQHHCDYMYSYMRPNIFIHCLYSYMRRTYLYILCSYMRSSSLYILTVPERKFVTKIRVRYHDPRWRRQQPVRMFTPRFLLFRIVFHVFDAGYRTIVSCCFYVIPESVIEFDKTAVNWCTKNTEDLGNSSVRSW